MKRQFQTYIRFVENIKDNYEKVLASRLIYLDKCRFYTYANNRSLQAKILEYEIDSRFLHSSHDKEHDDAQFLQIRVSMAKLQPLLYHCKFFMKCILCTKFL